jgi:hypothetical protein
MLELPQVALPSLVYTPSSVASAAPSHAIDLITAIVKEAPGSKDW